MNVLGGAAAVLWCPPSIALAVGSLATGRVRFALVMAWVDALRAAGRVDVARRLYEGEAARCARRRRALAGRRG